MAYLLYAFDDAAAVRGWQAIDDRVMGGVSRSRLRHDAAGHAVFEGRVSLDRGGGFASVRSPAADHGAACATALLIEAFGDGHRYKLALFGDDGFDSIGHQAPFTPEPGCWSTVRLPLAGFVATFRGRPVPGSGAPDPARIRQLGLLIAERQAGGFSLALRSIQRD